MYWNPFKLVLLFLLALILNACGKKEKPTPKPSDLNSHGVLQPLDNETDPDKIENWFTKGPKDGVEGLDIERAFRNLRLNLNPKEIIVAVIDSGIDLNHPDLQGQLWINQREAQGITGIDDDQNGYVDDIHGWNFIGGYDNEGRPIHIKEERLESTRELVRLKRLRALLMSTGQNLSVADEIYYQKLNFDVTGDRTVIRIQLKMAQAALERLAEIYKRIEARLNIPFEKLTLEAVETFKAESNDEQQAKEELMVEFNSAFAKSIERLHIRTKTMQLALDTALNENFDPRAEVINDNPNDFTNGIYGNNDVTGPDALHGTHVAGIIAALRNNSQGINGVSPYAKIMAIRAIPQGDEYDKDVYFAVKYAVDNGAKIINLSFGKKYSPHKTKLDEIFNYASDRGVLLVHAAGNTGQNNDKARHYPNRFLAGPNREAEIKNWIEVGASTKLNTAALIPTFTNYGKRNVDIFAPGHEILSTSPHNTYTLLSGTSMAAPMVSGLLSIIWAQNPDLTATQVKQLVLRNGRNKDTLKVMKPGISELTELDQLCRTGAVVDSYKALEKTLSL